MALTCEPIYVFKFNLDLSRQNYFSSFWPPNSPFASMPFNRLVTGLRALIIFHANSPIEGVLESTVRARPYVFSCGSKTLHHEKKVEAAVGSWPKCGMGRRSSFRIVDASPLIGIKRFAEMNRTAGKFGEATHNPCVLRIESGFFLM
jgi:hypothetical protein